MICIHPPYSSSSMPAPREVSTPLPVSKPVQYSSIVVQCTSPEIQAVTPFFRYSMATCKLDVNFNLRALKFTSQRRLKVVLPGVDRPDENGVLLTYTVFAKMEDDIDPRRTSKYVAQATALYWDLMEQGVADVYGSMCKLLSYKIIRGMQWGPEGVYVPDPHALIDATPQVTSAEEYNDHEDQDLDVGCSDADTEDDGRARKSEKARKEAHKKKGKALVKASVKASVKARQKSKKATPSGTSDTTTAAVLASPARQFSFGSRDDNADDTVFKEDEIITQLQRHTSIQSQSLLTGNAMTTHSQVLWTHEQDITEELVPVVLGNPNETALVVSRDEIALTKVTGFHRYFHV